VGNCLASKKVCAADGNSFGACSAEVLPQAQENCKIAGDENCDGVKCSDADWGSLFGDGQDQTPKSIAVDSMGNVVVAGSFKGTLTLAPGVAVTSIGARDFFLAQFDSMGTPLWIKRFGDAADNGTSIHVAIDKANEIIIAGGITGKADFGSGAFLPAAGGGSSDIFVAKYGQTGTFQWAQVVGDALSQDASSVVTDATGNIILGGQYQGTFSYSGNGPAAANGSDGFVTKLMPNGTPLWSKRLSDSPAKATDVQSVVDVAVDSQNNIVFTGYFQTSVSVGAINISELGGGDIYLAKLTPSGSEQWAKAFGTTSIDFGNAIAVDSADHILLTGYFSSSGTINFGGGTISAQGLYDGFIASFNSAGIHQWSKRFGSPNDNSGIPDEGRDIAIDKADNVLLTGLLYGTANFGGAADMLTSAGGSDVFIAKLDTTGAHLWSKIFGDLNDQTVGGIATDPVTGQVLLATGVQGSINFGKGSLPASGIDVGVAKFEP
jgi:hypothetical protein